MHSASKWKSNLKHPSSQRPATENNILAQMKTNITSDNILFREQQRLLKTESTKATGKTDMELLAQNRGNAMLRYKEKKKTRR